MRKIPLDETYTGVGDFLGVLYDREGYERRKYYLHPHAGQFEFVRHGDTSRQLCGHYTTKAELVERAQRCTKGASAVFEFDSKEELDIWLAEDAETSLCPVCQQAPCGCLEAPALDYDSD